LIGVRKIHHALYQSYREDFIKYNKRVDLECIDSIFSHLPAFIGKQVKYTSLDPVRRIEKIKLALLVLTRSFLIHKVHAVSSVKQPLSAHKSDSVFKLVFLDIGLLQSLCGLDNSEVFTSHDILDTYRGAIAEQFAGQQMLQTLPADRTPELFYWARAEKTSIAEIDYLINYNNHLHPVEVKSSAAGRLKSIQLFLKENPESGDGIVLSSRNVSFDRERKLRFLPLYSHI
jgi:predicted AAA+ superfamily ATPase